MDHHNGEDFLTNLPEDIITRVLSRLSAKDAFRTCLLSKAWEYRWTMIHKIDIRDSELLAKKSPKKDEVVQFVDKFIFFSRTPVITKFRLSLFHNSYNPVRVATWITAVLLKKVENLHVDFNHEGVVLPRILFQCTSVTKLKLTLPCIFRVPVSNSFASLKVFHLSFAQILSEDCSKPFVLNFPVLETLRLGNCQWSNLESIDIKSPCLTNLFVNEIELISGGRPTTQRCLVKVSESKCLSFDYFGSCLGRFDMTDSSVHSITLRHDGAFGRPNQAFGKNGLNAKILLAGCSRLYHLELSGFFADAIFRSSRGPQIPQLIWLKRLDLCWSYNGCNGGAILKLLHVMPSLESIKIDVQGGRDDYDYDSVESVPPCIACHLNEVVFVGFEGRRQEVKLADFLLKNGVGLKKMLGLSRDKSSERRAQREFWDRLRGAYQMGDLELGPSVLTMADFQIVFG